MPSKSQHICCGYNSDTLTQAVQAVRERHLSFGAASKEFLVLKSTLKDLFNGQSSLKIKAGRKRSIPEEVENDIVYKVIAAAAECFHLTKGQFLAKVGLVVKNLGRQTQFKNGVPADDYWRYLKKR